MGSEPKSAAEWLERVAKRIEGVGYGMGYDPTHDLCSALAMLRDAKAELENLKLAHEAYHTCKHCKAETGWEAVEAKWREGKYRG